MSGTRSEWTSLTDRQLLEQCEVDTYRASGPGGQKRNKTSSAVRLRHLPSGLRVIAEESRSQHENRARALRRLRRRLFLDLREPFPPNETTGWPAELAQHQLKLGVRDERFWPAVGLALDALAAHAGRVSAAAEALGVSTARLVAFLESDSKAWAEANEIRKLQGQRLLR